MSQVTYLPLLVLPVDNLAATTKSTVEEIHRAPSLLAFIASRERGKLGALTDTVLHPSPSLLKTYVEEVILFHIGPP